MERAGQQAQFPTTADQPRRPEEHLIRLIIRLLFLWFVKEKNLVAENLFIENQGAELLTNYDRTAGACYYRAGSPNLFFAPLRTPRRPAQLPPMALPALFNQTPFTNGGLFFDHNPVQPEILNLLDRYQFTIEENTSIEQEVALDLKLLSQVLENSFAAYNPETKETTRQPTGSCYTPREVVDYMGEEALAEKSQSPDNAKPNSKKSASSFNATNTPTTDATSTSSQTTFPAAPFHPSPATSPNGACSSP